MTLTGFGGIGKTRLAVRVAAEVRRAFPAGVTMVDLAPVMSPALLPDAFAQSLGLYTSGSAPVTDRVVAHLCAREQLLLVDNCEHVLEACVEMVEEILHRCPDIRILATSREPLGIGGESVLSVPPLPLRSSDGPAGEQAGGAALTMFVDRAAAACPGFRLTEQNHHDIVNICRKLDCIPLAIELVAVRLRGLTPAQLADQLADEYSLLDTGSRTAPDRQRTLRGCIEWSFGLCTEAEQKLWARASVFAGGFELDAVTDVCRGPGIEPGGQLLHTLLSLVDKSILTCEPFGEQMRYRMLEVIRQYGMHRLETDGELGEYRTRHRDHFAALAARPERDWAGRDHRVWMDRMSRERSNIQTALQFCLTNPGGADIGLRMAGGGRDHWVNTGAISEGLRWIENLLRSGPTDPVSQAWALRTAGWLALLFGEIDYATDRVREGLLLNDDADVDASAMFDALSALCRIVVGDFAEAIEDAGRGLERARRAANAGTEFASLNCLQLAYSCAGEFDRALEYHRAAVQRAKPIGDTWNLSYSLWIAGLAQWAQGNVSTADTTLRGNLRKQNDIGNEIGVAMGLELVAIVTVSMDASRGTLLLGAAEARWDSIGLHIAVIPILRRFHARCLDAVTAMLGPGVVAEKREQGARLPLDEALDMAVGDARDPAANRVEPTRHRSVAARSKLTRREGEVAELIARGLSNREIAKTLVIAQRTAETHVERILTKLGFTSRVQVAVWMHRHNLTAVAEVTGPQYDQPD
ncbi:ATP-binding protein [Nocardia colli]|uniref:ATP-binding protein n=1 Tax=Nocardia colli TaxID=2545717 RepID=UPI0035E3647F